MSRRFLTTAALVAVLGAAGYAQQQNRPWPVEGPPRPLAERPVRFPPYDIRKLPNGLQVVLVSHHEQPAVSIRLIVRAGAAHDPKGKLGLAMLTAALLDQGAAGRSAAEIADEIDFIGGILGTGAGTDLTYANAIVMKDDLATGLRLLSDVVRRPAFASDEIERQRQQAISGLKVSAEDPDTVASQVIDRLVYGFHPYGLPGSGTAESLSSLTRDDFVQFHRQHYVPNNALLAIVGDVTADDAMAGVQKAFGDWASGQMPPFAPIDPPAPTKRVVVIDKKDAVQTEIRVGQIAIPRKHPDFMALDQAVKILGGEGANRLQQVLRSQRGLTYGASADLDSYKWTGGIVAETDTRTSATAEVLRTTVDEVMKLQRERVYDGELSGAQAYLAGHFPLTIETPDAIATQVLNQLFYDLPLEELQTFPERVQRITPEDVQRVARAYFKPDRLAVVLVGNADAFVKDLPGIGFPDFERIPMDQVDLLAGDLKRSGAPTRRGGPMAGGGDFAIGQATPLRYQEKPSVDNPAIALLRKAIDARGGLTALSGVKTLSASADTTLMTPDGQVAAKTTTYIEYPEKVRVEAALPQANIVQIYADGKAWLWDPAGVHDAPPEVVNEFRAAARRDLLALLLAGANGKYKAELKGEEGHQGRVLRVVELSGEGTQTLRVLVDAQNGEVVKIAYDTTGPVPVKTEEVFTDYRTVDGISLPFKASVSRNGTVVLERVLTDIKINPPLGRSMFTKPQ